MLLRSPCGCMPQPCCSQLPELAISRLVVKGFRYGVRSPVACSSQPARFRQNFDPRKDKSGFSDMGFTQRFGDDALQQSDSDNEAHNDAQPSSPSTKQRINIRNRFAGEASLIPIRMSPLSNEEYYSVSMKRNYSSDWPSIEVRPGGAIVYRRGFLEPLEDPESPFQFIYSGIEKFSYSLPERIVQAVATTIFIALYTSSFMALYTWQPQFAAAALVSWLRHTLTPIRWASIIALAAIDKMWIFWLLVVGKEVDKQLAVHIPGLRKFMWFWFKAWLAFCLLSTAITPALPFWPFMPNASPFEYPFAIFRMGG